MKKQRTTITILNLRWGAFLVVLVFFGIQIMPRVLGQRTQREISQRTSNIEAPSNLDGGTWTITGSRHCALSAYGNLIAQRNGSGCRRT